MASRSVPAATFVSPVYVAVPENSRTPEPIFVKPPVPERVWLMPRSNPLLSMMIPPACTFATSRFVMNAAWLSRALRMPPLKLTVALPVPPSIFFVVTVPPSRLKVPVALSRPTSTSLPTFNSAEPLRV